MKKNKPSAATQLTDNISSVIKTHTQAGAFFLLALSGGVDSMVLLHALAALKEKHGFKLHALHVHHGLSQFADDWAHLCQEVCASLTVPLAVVHVCVDRAAKAGIEAEARAQRYQALFAYRDGLQLPDFVLTAHHEQDQAETLLLQLSRGAGVKGLAAMAVTDEKRRLLRPLLAIQKADIIEYAKAHALHWCEDDSNTHTRFERNFLRHEILSGWSARHAAIHQNIARSATHLAEAATLLDELAITDSETLLNKNSLCLIGLTKLTPMRMKNLLRWWLARFGMATPNTDYLQEIMTQLLCAKNDANIHFRLGDYVLRRYQQRAYVCFRAMPAFQPMDWRGEDQLLLPDGALYFKQAKGAGLLRANQQTRLTVGLRRGGERIKITENRPTRSLKYLMQAQAIPTWARVTWPLILLDDQLACVPNIGVDVALQTQENELGFLLFYQPKLPSFVA